MIVLITVRSVTCQRMSVFSSATSASDFACLPLPFCFVDVVGQRLFAILDSFSGRDGKVSQRYLIKYPKKN